LTNKIIIDANDPNRPRFTIAELKEILCERNELKARVSDLMDELTLYRPQQNHHHSKYVVVDFPSSWETRYNWFRNASSIL